MRMRGGVIYKQDGIGGSQRGGLVVLVEHNNKEWDISFITHSAKVQATLCSFRFLNKTMIILRLCGTPSERVPNCWVWCKQCCPKQRNFWYYVTSFGTSTGTTKMPRRGIPGGAILQWLVLRLIHREWSNVSCHQTCRTVANDGI